MVASSFELPPSSSDLTVRLIQKGHPAILAATESDHSPVAFSKEYAIWRQNMLDNILDRIDRLKEELDELRPLPQDAIARVEQKLRIESNYHTRMRSKATPSLWARLAA